MSQTVDPVELTKQYLLQAAQAGVQHFLGYLNSSEAARLFGVPAMPLEVPDAARLADWQENFLQQHQQLLQAILPASSAKPEIPAAADVSDRRFSAPEWSSSIYFDYLRRSYSLNVYFFRQLVELLPVEDEKSRQRLRFLARQYLDAIAPSNFAVTNPEFIQRALQTQGKSIADGLGNLIEDLERGRISMTDESAFSLGENLATTPGFVVFENELIQLIQYAPATSHVAKQPLLIVPPCINKFYILDLQAETSFVRYAIEQGHTVFMISWRNPKAEQERLTWDDYLELGPLAALAVVREICKVPRINALGFCVGGTILSAALAVLAARGEDWVASLTLLTTLLDFSDTGEIGLFIDAQTCALRDATIGQGGLLSGRELASTFSLLRANDLIWNYVAANYLKGLKPPAFDLLYWNADSTNLPGPFAAWYTRNFYLDNSFRVPGKLSMCGVPVSLDTLKMPSYLLATRDDHIVPWKTAYESTRLLGGEKRFVLGASGHIAGVVNPVSKNKRSYWLNADLAGDAETWLSAAHEYQGSWWRDWAAWLKQQTDETGYCLARKKIGSARYKKIEPAPGRYVKEKA